MFIRPQVAFWLRKEPKKFQIVCVCVSVCAAHYALKPSKRVSKAPKSFNKTFWLRKEPKRCKCCGSVGGFVGLWVRPHYALQLF